MSNLFNMVKILHKYFDSIINFIVSLFVLQNSLTNHSANGLKKYILNDKKVRNIKL